jgi:bis(5'-nucleosyl)-tetraphosphatase (symmetrical)
MAVYAIGDIQGCHREFCALLERLGFDAASDRLWLTGDLVNRGPDSLAVLRSVRALGPAATVVLGNHDLHLLARAAGAGPPREDPGLNAVLAAPDRDELLGWLMTRPLMHRDPALGWTLVHAGLPPQWDLDTAEACAREVEAILTQDPLALFSRMYGDDPRLWSPGLAGAARLRFITNCLTRLRYVDRAGRLLLEHNGPPADAPAGAIPWFRHPARASAAERIVFGHWSTLGVVREAKVLGIDAGCVWGGALCAARLDEPGEPILLPCRGALRPGED